MATCRRAPARLPGMRPGWSPIAALGEFRSDGRVEASRTLRIDGRGTNFRRTRQPAEPWTIGASPFPCAPAALPDRVAGMRVRALPAVCADKRRRFGLRGITELL
jgi:hypothetical protein